MGVGGSPRLRWGKIRLTCGAGVRDDSLCYGRCASGSASWHWRSIRTPYKPRVARFPGARLVGMTVGFVCGRSVGQLRKERHKNDSNKNYMKRDVGRHSDSFRTLHNLGGGC